MTPSCAITQPALSTWRKSSRGEAECACRQAEILPGMGHGMMLERDWELGAMRIADWLAERAL